MIMTQFPDAENIEIHNDGSVTYEVQQDDGSYNEIE